jgi:hypothetical protein
VRTSVPVAASSTLTRPCGGSACSSVVVTKSRPVRASRASSIRWQGAQACQSRVHDDASRRATGNGLQITSIDDALSCVVVVVVPGAVPVVAMVAVLRVWGGSSAHVCMEATTTGAISSTHPGFWLVKGLTRHAVGLVAAVVGVPDKGLAQLTAIAAVLVLAFRLNIGHHLCRAHQSATTSRRR